jgi:Glycosyltransferase sugar-binding region containing DXD motif
MRPLRKFLLPCALVAILLVVTFNFISKEARDVPIVAGGSKLELDRSNRFEGFNNETGVDEFIVPNVIHYIRFNKTSFSFVDYVCIRSAWINHRPEIIYFHTNVDKFSGVYWDRMVQDAEFFQRIKVVPIELPSEVFGQPLSTGWRLFHGSDVARIRMMKQYGGIYLDNDIYVVRNLDKYRKFEIAMGWDENQFLGSQVIIAHKEARFLDLWLDTYREYHADKW